MKPLVFVGWPTLKIPLLDIEFNSAYYSSAFTVNTCLLANVTNEYELEDRKTSVFWTERWVFVEWPTLKISPFDREFNFAYYSSAFTVNTSLLANVSREYYLENPQNSVFWTKPLVFFQWPTLKNNYSIENLILHITEVVSELTQVFGGNVSSE